MVLRIMKWLAYKIISYCEKKDKIFVITTKDHDGNDKPYLIRYTFINNKYFCFYVHRFLTSDPDGPHDHPWFFMTYILEGAYLEEFYKFNFDVPDTSSYQEEARGKSQFSIQENKRTVGSLAFRRSTDVHKVELEKELTMEEKHLGPLTFCITGPRIREWNFWPGKTSTKRRGIDGHYSYWANKVLWTKHLGIEDDTEKRG